MKLKLFKNLLKALLAACLVSAPIALAQTITTNTGAETYFTDDTTDDVVINFVSANDDYFNNTSFSTDDNIQVQSWLIGNGWGSSGTNHNYTYTFNGSISDYTGEGAGDGNIRGWNWSDKFYNVTFAFNGDMSGFSGNISAGVSGLGLSFGGSARNSVSGTGAIDTYTAVTDAGRIKPVTYDVGTGTSSISNSSITTHTLNINGGADVIYNIGGTGADAVATSISTQTFASEAATTINMGANTSLTVVNSFTSEANFSFAEGSSLSVANATSLGDLTISGAVDFDLSVDTAMSALTTGTFTLDAGATLTLNIALTGAQTAGTTYTLLDAGNDLSGIDINSFILSLTGAPATSLGYDASGNLVLTIDRSSANLTWGTTNGTWRTGDGGWTDSAATFENTDTVTFTNDTADTTREITIDGEVLPSSIVVSGEGDTHFLGSGSISGSTGLTKDGTGTLTISTSNSYTGDTAINSGTLTVENAQALGTGNVNVAADATLGLGYAEAMGDLANVTLNTGSSLLIDRNLTYTDAITNKLTTGITLKVADGVTASIDTGTTYSNSAQDYTIELGDGATLNNDAILLISGDSITTIKGSTPTGMGTYIVEGLRLSAANEVGDSTFNIEAGATLKVEGTALSTYGDTGSFMMSNWTRNNVVNISGVLDIASGISNRNGTGVINILDGGEFIMRRGLAAATDGTTRSDVTINVEDGATLTLYNKDTSNGGIQIGHSIIVPDVNIKDGATIKAAEAGKTVLADTISYAADAHVTFDIADSAQSLEIEQTVSIKSATIKGAGTYTGTTLTLTEGGNTLSVAGSSGKMSISNKNATDASSTTQLTATTLTGLNISNAAITHTGAGLAISDSKLDTVSVDLSNVTLTSTELRDSTVSGLTSTQVGIQTDPAEDAPEDALTFNVNGLENTTITGSLTLNLGDLDALGTSPYTFSEYYDNGGIVAFVLEGVTKEEFKTWYGVINLNIDGTDYQAQGIAYTATGVMVYIPEPSTATLSLLALAGMLVRRRRKAA